PVNDARAMAATLAETGFLVTAAYETDLKSMKAVTNEFVGTLQPEDVALLYYSGHGMQFGSENYLVPIDFVNRDDEDEALAETFSAQHLVTKVEERGVRMTILILDACRSSPFRGVKGGTKGLAMMQPGHGRGAFIAFATAPGATAADSPQAANGLFTGFLLKAMAEPGLRLDEVFNEVRRGVYQASNGKQAPWTSSSIIGDFYFRPMAKPPASPAEEKKEKPPIPEGRAMIGITLVPFTPEYGRQHGFPALESGVVIDDLLPSGPAALAGVRKGDVIRRVNGKAMTVNTLNAEVLGEGPAVLDLWRGSEHSEVTVTPVDGLELFQAACKQGEGYGCDGAGDMYWSGDKVTKDLPVAVSFYDRGCSLGSLKACYSMGYALDAGIGIYRDAARAAPLYERACKGGLLYSCRDLGSLYLAGSGVAKSPSKAATLYQQACDGNDMQACRLLGDLYVSGNGIVQDSTKASLLYEKGCNGGLLESCDSLGRRLRDDKEPRLRSRAVELFGRACDGGNLVGCTDLGRELRNGKNVPRDLPRSLALFGKACEKGWGEGCFEQGFMYEKGLGVTADARRSADLYKQACAKGYGNGCFASFFSKP
ncbi:MAG TPA: caspase family protein, partial [Thermoanaerobaculia bacterium]|nr:caspase family protein [Thermoanaerobaculia bacterium]